MSTPMLPLHQQPNHTLPSDSKMSKMNSQPQDDDNISVIPLDIPTTLTPSSTTTLPPSIPSNVANLTLPILASTPSAIKDSNNVKSMADFELIRVLGRGSYGKVFLTRRSKTGELLAMKVMKKREVVNRNVLDNIRAERTVLESIKHPYLVALRYAFQTEEKLYLLMTYQSGGEMFAKMERDGVFTEYHARFYLEEIIVALNYLHSQNIVYRDLKPENVLFKADGHCCLTDFGFAKKFADEADATTKSFCGSLQYLAPEIVNKLKYDKSVDFWCCGIFFFEMLTGRTPFQSSKRNEILNNILKKEIKWPKNFSKPLISLLQGLLNRDPEKRLTFEQIKKHPYFATTNWKDVEMMKTKPPFIPTLKNELDVSLFDPRFTEEDVIDTPPFGPSGLVGHDAFRQSSLATENILPPSSLPQQPSLQPQQSSSSSSSTTIDSTTDVVHQPFSNDREGLRHFSRRMTPVLSSNNNSSNGLPPPPQLSLNVHKKSSRARHSLQLSDDDSDETAENTDLFPELPPQNADGTMTMTDENGKSITFRNSIKNKPPELTTTASSSTRKESIFYTSDDNDPKNVFKNFSFSSPTPDLQPNNVSNNNSMSHLDLTFSHKPEQSQIKHYQKQSKNVPKNLKPSQKPQQQSTSQKPQQQLTSQKPQSNNPSSAQKPKTSPTKSTPLTTTTTTSTTTTPTTTTATVVTPTQQTAVTLIKPEPISTSTVASPSQPKIIESTVKLNPTAQPFSFPTQSTNTFSNQNQHQPRYNNNNNNNNPSNQQRVSRSYDRTQQSNRPTPDTRNNNGTNDTYNINNNTQSTYTPSSRSQPRQQRDYKPSQQQHQPITVVAQSKPATQPNSSSSRAQQQQQPINNKPNNNDNNSKNVPGTKAWSAMFKPL